MAIEPQTRSFLSLTALSAFDSTGVDLGERSNHAVWELIRSRSSLARANAGDLFTASADIPLLRNAEASRVSRILTRMLAASMIAGVVRLHFEPETGRLFPVVHYLTHPLAENETAEQLYQATLGSSARAVEQYIEVQQPGTDALEYDLRAQFEPKDANESAQGWQSLVVDFAQWSGIQDLQSPLSRLQVAEVTEDTYATILARKTMIELGSFGALPVPEARLAELLDLAANFLMTRVIPRYINRGNLRNELSAIAGEEAMHLIQRSGPRKAEFLERRAAAVRQVLSILSQGESLPGQLAVEVVLVLAPIMAPRHRTEWTERNERVYQELTEPLMNPAHWADAILLLDGSKLEAMASENWQRLVSDPHLLYGVWEANNNTVHVFVRNSPDSFRLLVREMITLPKSEFWKVLAMRELLESFEKDFRGLFADAQFRDDYGALLRRVYVDHIPWYFRILWLLPGKPLQDQGFQVAKARIREDQARLQRSITRRALEQQSKAEVERNSRVEQIQRLTQANQVIEKLDQCYRIDRRIPTAADIKALLPDLSEDEFMQILKREKFQVLRPSGDARQGVEIVLYPLDREWRRRRTQLKEFLDQVHTEIENARARAQRDFSVELPDEQTIQRLELLRKYLGKVQGRLPRVVPDPYAQLEREVKKYSAVEERLEQLSQEELQV